MVNPSDEQLGQIPIERPKGEAEYAHMMEMLQRVTPEVTSRIEELSRGLDATIVKFTEFSAGVERIVGGVGQATEKVGGKIEESAEKFKTLIAGVADDIGKVTVHFEEMGQRAVREMGFVGEAVERLGGRLRQIPYIGAIAGVVAGFALIALSAKLFEEEAQARALRVEHAYRGLGFDIWRISGEIQNTITELHSEWGMRFEEAEGFMKSLATVGRVDFGQGVAAGMEVVAKTVLGLHVVTGFTKEVVTEHLRAIYHTTNLTGQGFNFATERLKEFYIWGMKSGIGLSEFTNIVMRGIEQIKFMGTEMRALPEVAEFFMGIRDVFGDRLGLAGVRTMFEGMMGVVGNVMRDPGMFMWTFGLRGNPLDAIPKMVGELLRGGEGIDPGRVFQQFMEQIIPLGRDAAVGMLAMQMPGGFTPENIMQAAKIFADYTRLQEQLRELRDSNASQEEIERATKAIENRMGEAGKQLFEMKPPLERIQMIMEEFVRNTLPRIVELIVGSLGVLINTIIWMGAKAVNTLMLFDDPLAALEQEAVQARNESLEVAKKGFDGLVSAFGVMGERLFRQGIGIDRESIDRLIPPIAGVVSPTRADVTRPPVAPEGVAQEGWWGVVAGTARHAGERWWDATSRVVAQDVRFWRHILGLSQDERPQRQGVLSPGAGSVSEPSPRAGIGIVPRVMQVRADTPVHRYGEMDIKITLRAADIFKVVQGAR